MKPGSYEMDLFKPKIKNVIQMFEKDVKVDKAQLTIMINGGNEELPSINEFLKKVSLKANVDIMISTSMQGRQGNEIPVLKVKSYDQKNIEIATALIMEQLDPHRDKMTFNIDVPYNDHSYIIGKNGARIKQLSRITSCHIHLPDCNKTSGKKSNKISIAGTEFASIDQARDAIRKSLPLNIAFKAQIKSAKFAIIDTASAEVQAVKRKYHVDVTFTNVISYTKFPEITINIKGSRLQLEDIQHAAEELYQYVTEENLSTNLKALFTITIDISRTHHQYVKGKNNCNIQVIKNRSNADILFPDENDTSNLVVIQSKTIPSTMMAWQELMGYLPLLLSFDVKFNINKHDREIQKLEKEFGIGVRFREKLAGHVYTVLIKTQERHSTYLQEIRQRIFQLNQKPKDNYFTQNPFNNNQFKSSINQNSFLNFENYENRFEEKASNGLVFKPKTENVLQNPDDYFGANRIFSFYDNNSMARRGYSSEQIVMNNNANLSSNKTIPNVTTSNNNNNDSINSLNSPNLKRIENVTSNGISNETSTELSNALSLELLNRLSNGPTTPLSLGLLNRLSNGLTTGIHHGSTNGLNSQMATNDHCFDCQLFLWLENVMNFPGPFNQQ